MRFVHLHVHSHYSLLDGLTKIDELISTAKEDGAEALALTDHGVMYGVVEFYQKCKSAGIKPIIGTEIYLAPSSRFDKSAKSDEKYYHLLLLAKNNHGYKNLIKITTIAHLEGFYYKPRIDWEILQKYHQGLIACTGCLKGEVPYLILINKPDKAREKILEYNRLFGQNNFYLELMHHPNIEGLDEVNKKLIEFSKELNIPLIASNDVHYLNKEDSEPQDILLCLQNKKKKQDQKRMNMSHMNVSMRRSSEMIEIFKNTPEAINNTLKIAERCNVEIELGKIQYPSFNVPEGYNADDYLKKLCQDGLIKRYRKNYNQINSEIKTRLDYELSVIKDMGWQSYFLIVADLVNWAKKNGITVGPGRGSAAGSLVCYLTEITNLDPLKYNLLFERFLNPERVSMPDIDLDFADERRDDVIKYAEKKYGKDHVSQIITFGTMAARGAVRDVGRVLGYPYDYCDKLAKMIPMFSKIDIALKEVGELKQIYRNEEAAQKILNYAQRLEGVARHASTHACGVLITKDILTNYVPLQYTSSSDRTIVSQYSLHPIEDLGLLKIDILGLKNLTIIESTIKILKNTRGIYINSDDIPLNDKKTYKLFQDGRTTGVFQFESSGMKRCLQNLKPTEFEDLIAMVALYRPGPIEWIPEYITGKHKKRKINYLHPKLEPILKKTYGVVIYQEQVMQIARDLAGFSMGQADILRKAVGKKVSKLLKEQREKFIAGCVKNSIHSKLAEQIFSFIEPFAGYGFNRSHATCYAMIGYQTAYLKAHWPTEFMAALLTSDQQNIDRISTEIEECRNMDINIMPPDINESFSNFTVVTSGTKNNRQIYSDEKVNTIRFGLRAIKNVGANIAEKIIQERKKNGPYKNIFDFLERVTDKDMNKKSLESLIKCGGFDKYESRGKLLANLNRLLNFNKEINKIQNNKQVSLFTNTPILNTINYPTLNSDLFVDQQQILSWEKELLGLYITEHPFNEYKKFLQEIIVPFTDLEEYPRERNVNIAGIIINIQKITTRANEPMLFVKLEDGVRSLEILVFPSLLKETPDLWKEGIAILCQGRLSNKKTEIKLLTNKAVKLELNNIQAAINKFKNIKNKVLNQNQMAGKQDYYLNNNKSVILYFNKNLTMQDMRQLKILLLNNSGNNKVYFKINQNLIKTNFQINYNNNFIKLINQFNGKVEVLK